MGLVTDPYDFTANTPARAAEVDSRFSTLYTLVNGNLDAANLAAGAVATDELAAGAVTHPKIASGANGLAVGCFRAYRASTNQALTASGQVCQFNGEDFDVSGWYDSASSVRYTPLVAGYYRLAWQIALSSVAANEWAHSRLMKKAAEEAYSSRYIQPSGGAEPYLVGSAVVLANGVDDYFEVQVTYGGATNPSVYAGRQYTWFAGEFIGRS